jgi:hypothetical protein
MNSLAKIAMASAIVFGISNSAMASSYECDSGPKSEWKTKDEAKAVVLAEGYEVRKTKVNGGCYEFYATKDGKRVEVFVNPSTLEIVKFKED